MCNLPIWQLAIGNRQSAIGNQKSKIQNQSVPLEIEKKYRLTEQQRELVLERLPALGAKLKATEFEENTLYTSETIDLGKAILRLRRVGKRAILTYKKRFPTSSTIKRQQEEETEVSDPEALAEILQALGFSPTLVYEKRRMSWHVGTVEIVLDELPFGLFMEIEGSVAGIQEVEQMLAVKGLQAEESTYPRLTLEHGKKLGDVIESRFARNEK